MGNGVDVGWAVHAGVYEPYSSHELGSDTVGPGNEENQRNPNKQYSLLCFNSLGPLFRIPATMPTVGGHLQDRYYVAHDSEFTYECRPTA